MHFFSDYEQGNEQPELINSDRRLCGAVWGPWIHQLTQGDADVGKFTVHVQSDLSGACDWSGGGSRVLRRRCRKAESPKAQTLPRSELFYLNMRPPLDTSQGVSVSILPSRRESVPQKMFKAVDRGGGHRTDPESVVELTLPGLITSFR